ncbi:MAG: hypothetical protein R2709_00345 [Marmoricola sp.]
MSTAPLRRALLKWRRHRPEIVLTINHHETFGGSNLNQADCYRRGASVLDAVRDAGNRWVFPEQLTGWARALGWGA